MRKILLSALLILTVFSTSLVAASFELNATPTEPWNWTNFTISWEDTNGDFRFDLNEPFTWNGVTFLPFMKTYWQLLKVPDLPYTAFAGHPEDSWQFGPASQAFFVDKAQWTYDCNAPQIPIPGSILLLGSGLLGLGLLKLRRKPKFKKGN
jgi:hypothetical protein